MLTASHKKRKGQGEIGRKINEYRETAKNTGFITSTASVMFMCDSSWTRSSSQPLAMVLSQSGSAGHHTETVLTNHSATRYSPSQSVMWKQTRETNAASSFVLWQSPHVTVRGEWPEDVTISLCCCFSRTLFQSLLEAINDLFIGLFMYEIKCTSLHQSSYYRCIKGVF